MHIRKEAWIAPFGSLFLSLAVIATLRPASGGFRVIPPASMSFAQCDGINSRIIVLHISKGHFVRINMEPVSENRLSKRLKQIYRERAERVLFVRAEPELTFQQVVQILDIANGSVKDLYISLLTPAAEREPCLAISLPTGPNWLLIPPGLR